MSFREPRTYVLHRAGVRKTRVRVQKCQIAYPEGVNCIPRRCVIRSFRNSCFVRVFCTPLPLQNHPFEARKCQIADPGIHSKRLRHLGGCNLIVSWPRTSVLHTPAPSKAPVRGSQVTKRRPLGMQFDFAFCRPRSCCFAYPVGLRFGCWRVCVSDTCGVCNLTFSVLHTS